MARRWGKSGNSGRFYFPVLQNHCGWWLQPWNYKKLAPWKKSYDKPTKHIKKQRLYFDNKNPSCQRYDFSSSHVWMGDLGYKEGWASKNWCFQMVVLEKTLESPLDCKVKPVNPKGNQSWIFIEGLMLKLKLQYFGHLMQRADSLERSWCWERLKTKGEEGSRGWDG